MRENILLWSSNQESLRKEIYFTIVIFNNNGPTNSYLNDEANIVERLLVVILELKIWIPWVDPLLKTSIHSEVFFLTVDVISGAKDCTWNHAVAFTITLIITRTEWKML